MTLDITPDHPVTLGAGHDLTTPFQRVAEPLEANLAVLRPASGNPVLLVSLDLLYPGAEIRSRVADAVALPSDRLWVVASHTHRAPLTDATKPGLGTVDVAYRDAVADRIASAAKRLLESVPDHSSAQLSVGQFEANHSVNRRRPVRRPRRETGMRRRIRLAPNPGGSRDEHISVLVARDDDERAVFVLWNYACHPVSHPERHSVSAHFPFIVREMLRAELGVPELPVLFFQGFSGDTRPLASATPLRPWDVLKRVLAGPSFYDMSQQSYRTWAQSLGRTVATAVRASTPIESEAIVSRRIEAPVGEFVDCDRELDPVSFQSLRVGPSVVLAGVSAEVVSPYARWLRDRLGSVVTFCVGCMDEPFGYVPTSEMLLEGGYEAGGFCEAFGLDGIKDGIEDAVKTHLAGIVGHG